MSFYKEVPGRQTTLESTLKFDTEPKAGSTNPVTSDGVNTAITDAVGGASDALQEQIDDIAEKAGSGYIPKGEADVATLNGLSGQENGWLYTMTDAGTLTDGSLAVTAGDTVAWDETNSVWYKAMDYAPSQYGTNKIKNLPTSITAFRTGDVIPVDGPSGTAKMAKDTLLAIIPNDIPDNSISIEKFGYDVVTRSGTALTSENRRANAVKVTNNYVTTTGYSILSFPVSGLTRVHFKGSIDVVTRFDFMTSKTQVTSAYYVSTAYSHATTTLDEYDVYALVPATATYLMISVKDSIGVEVYDASSAAKIKGEKIASETIPANALSTALYGNVFNEIVSVNTRANAVKTGNSYVTTDGYSILSFPVTAGEVVRIKGSIDVVTQFDFMTSKMQVTSTYYVSTAYSHATTTLDEYDVQVKVPNTATYLMVSVKNSIGTYVGRSVGKKILASQVEGLGDSLSSLTKIYVATTGDDSTGDGSISAPFATILKACESIVSPSADNRYEIRVADGTYTDLQTKYAGSIPDGYEGVIVPPFTEIIGNVDNPSACVLQWDGAYGYAEGVYNYDDYGFYKCLFHILRSSLTCAIRGFKFVSSNTRYALHVETSGYGNGMNWEVSDCIFAWGGVVNRMSTPTIGTGSGNFENGKILRCKILNDSGASEGFRNHDSVNRYGNNAFKKGAKITIEDCDFGLGDNGGTKVTFRNSNGDDVIDCFDIVTLKNCKGISKFTYQISGASTKLLWRADVHCCEIADDDFKTNGYEN